MVQLHKLAAALQNNQAMVFHITLHQWRCWGWNLDDKPALPTELWTFAIKTDLFGTMLYLFAYLTVVITTVVSTIKGIAILIRHRVTQ